MSFGFYKMARVQRGVPAHEACTPKVQIYTCEKQDPAMYKDDPSKPSTSIQDFFFKSTNLISACS